MILGHNHNNSPEALRIEAEAERDGNAIRRRFQPYHNYKTKNSQKRKVLRGSQGANDRKGLFEVPK